MRIPGFSGTQRGRIKQYRKSGAMVGQCFHTGTKWGESLAGMATRTGQTELRFSFYRHPVLDVMAAMSLGPSIIPEGEGYAFTEAPEFYYSRVCNFEYVSADDIPAGLVTWIRENY